MTRKSRREIERALEDLDGRRGRTATRKPLAEYYDDAVEAFIHQVIRDLLLSRRENAPTDGAVIRFLGHVRDEYGIDENHDGDVEATVTAVSNRVPSPTFDGGDAFGTAVAAVARRESTTGTGELLADLIDTGEEERAARLLVQTTYDTLAEADGWEVAVA